MRRLFMIPLLAAGLALGGCGAGSRVGTAIDVLTTTVVNPVDRVDLYRVKSVYAASLKIANGYRSYCYARPYKALRADPVAKPICAKRRSVVRQMQAAKNRAAAALATAETFIANNPTLNATSALGAAWTAVTQFQALTAQYAVAN